MERRKKKKHPILCFFLVMFLLAVLAAAGACYYIYNEAYGAGKGAGEITISIPKGASTTAVANVLKENGLIDNSLVFRTYSKYVAMSDGTFQYGDFVIPMSATYDEIIAQLQVMVDYKETVKFTFPEGYNAFQMGAVLEEVGLTTQEEFIEVLNTHQFEFDFLETVSQDPSKLVSIEGFLFPDTYQVYTDEDVVSIINRILSNFQTRVLTDENLALLEASGLTMEEWVTLGSIVQKESANITEMYNVSAVFHNRLMANATYPKLESCTTNDYINDYIKPFYDGNAPSDVLSAYDTYGTPGLPIGAITNAGADALHATLVPNETPYYFFVTDVEYTHYYGKTYDEHLANIQKALAVNKTYGIDGLIT